MHQVDAAHDTADKNRKKKQKKLQTFDLGYFVSKSFFDDDG